MNHWITFILCSFVLSGCGRDWKSIAEPLPPAPKPGFVFQSKINSLTCQNQFRPQGTFISEEVFLATKSRLVLDRAEVYVELHDEHGKALRSTAGRMNPNSISGEFSAVLLCSAALPNDLSPQWGMAIFPQEFSRSEDLIPMDIGIIFPTVGEPMNWAHPAYVQPFTATESNMTHWFQLAASQGQIEIYEHDGEYEVMGSQVFSPMQDKTRWLQFFLARYKVPKTQSIAQ